jgi:regulator of sirC expression with transglutaminase-like and TPR domain
MQDNQLMRQFKQAINQDDPDLLLACLTLAQGVALPDLDLVATAARFNQLAEAAATCIDRQLGAVDQTQELCEFLYVDQGFQGDKESYYDPRNSFLPLLLDRKLGIPITLSALLLIVAEKLQIPAYGVGLPGHFIVGVNGPANAYHFDPFHSGRLVTFRECARMVEESTGYQGPFEPQWLTPVPTITIITRMLENLRQIYLARREWGNSLRVIQHLRVVVPDRVDLWRDEAVAALQQNELSRAFHCLEQYLSLAPHAADAAILREKMVARLDEWVKLN